MYRPISLHCGMIKKLLFRTLLVLALLIAILAGNLAIFSLTASKISEGTPIDKATRTGEALLVIDIQEGTTGSTSSMKAHKEQSEDLISRVNQLVEDMHARDQPIIFVRTEVANPLINLLNNSLARGSEGAKLDQRLLRKGREVVVIKRKNDPFLDTSLDQILRDRQVGKLVLVGLDAAHCVKSTVLAATNRGYRIAVIEEAVISEDEEMKEEALDEFRALGVEIISVE